MPRISSLGERCCGCGACAAACPKGVVDMRPDGCGFLRPEADAGLCVGCGLCERVCPALARRFPDGLEAAWWAKASDDGLRERSSSGGVFGLLARDVLRRGGAVYGAAFSGDFKAVRHVRVDSLEGLDDVMRSKYVQSSVGPEVYRGVEADLRAGALVLFCGTACQAFGLRGYLEARRTPMEGLLVVDVICHGVPSPEPWRRWLEYRERLAGGEARAVNFRSKTAGWQSCSVRYEYRTEQEAVKVDEGPFGDDWYMKAFLRNASLRGSCLSCSAKRSCGSDVTLGDFWGVVARHPEAFDERGVSAVVANTDAGRGAVERISPLLVRGDRLD